METSKATHSKPSQREYTLTFKLSVVELTNKQAQGLPFKLTDYLELVELTGRVIREDKRGYVENNLPPILQRLGIEPEQWLKMPTSFEKQYKS